MKAQDAKCKDDSKRPKVSKPLFGKTFYFDLKGYGKAAELEKSFILLGGKVDSCLSKDVTCVVTNSKEYSCLPLPSPFSTLTSPRPESLSGDTSSNLATSRGQMMVNRACAAKSPGSTDVLLNAERWHIKIITLEQAKKYVDKMFPNLSKQLLKVASKSESSANSHRQMIETKQLGDCYIKVESTCQQYRPIIKEFRNLPYIHFDNQHWDVCPFISERDPDANDNNEVRVQAVAQQQAQEEPTIAGKASNRHNITEVKTKKQKECGHCEMCDLKYHNLQQHLESVPHQQFMKNQSNYEKLDVLIHDKLSLTGLIASLTCEEQLPESEDDMLLLPDVPTIEASTCTEVPSGVVCPMLPVADTVTREPGLQQVESPTCKGAVNHYNLRSNHHVPDTSTVTVNSKITSRLSACTTETCKVANTPHEPEMEETLAEEITATVQVQVEMDTIQQPTPHDKTIPYRQQGNKRQRLNSAQKSILKSPVLNIRSSPRLATRQKASSCTKQVPVKEGKDNQKQVVSSPVNVVAFDSHQRESLPLCVPRQSKARRKLCTDHAVETSEQTMSGGVPRTRASYKSSNFSEPTVP